MRRTDLARKLVIAVTLAVAVAWVWAPASPALADSLTGAVQASDGTPLAGLTVYLVHPSAGRSTPVVTNRFGTFQFRHVPPIEDAYYLEIYWGADLIHRVRQRVEGDTVLGEPIVLGE